MRGPFAQVHRGLICNRYSPVPLLPRTKRPWVDGWQVLRTTHITPEDVARILATYPMAGVGVAGGFNGLVPVDVDTENADIIDRIVAVLPTPIVAKAGQKGFTAFYRGDVKACKMKDREGRNLVEVLTTGQSVIPPTVHPDTGLPYRWLTNRTLLDTSVDKLPSITEATLGALRETLAPFMRARATWVSVTPSHGTPAPTSGRLRAYAMAALRGEASSLASQMRGGRNNGVFAAGCRLGKWVHHKVISFAEVQDAVLNACNANGLVKDDGAKACIASLVSGVRKAVNDALPTLADRRPAQ